MGSGHSSYVAYMKGVPYLYDVVLAICTKKGGQRHPSWVSWGKQLSALYSGPISKILTKRLNLNGGVLQRTILFALTVPTLMCIPCERVGDVPSVRSR